MAALAVTYRVIMLIIAAMPQVHPTAIIDPAADLADDVVVGPWCRIEGKVQVSRGTRLIHGVWLKGPLTIGSDNAIYPGVALGAEPQDLKFAPDTPGAGLVIGAGNVFREHVTIHRATGEAPTTIGNGNYFMAGSHVGHDCSVADHCMFANGALIAGHCEIASRVIMGGNAVLHQFCRIGRLSMISGVGGVTLDLPPFCIVYRPRRVGSLNLVGLRRAGYRDSIQSLRQAFKLYFKSRHAPSAALDKIESLAGEDPLTREFIDFIRQSKRGVTRYASSRGDEELDDA